MAKRKATPTAAYRLKDLTSWNFILFLTLSFILLSVVIVAMKSTTADLRSRAGLACPKITLPRAEDCSGGWTYKRDTNGCLAFFCEVKPTPATKSTKK